MLNEPENSNLIGDWNESLNDFQKILLVRCLRLDRVYSCLMFHVSKSLGKKFLEPPVIDLKAIFNESQNKIPLVFVLSAGVDPTSGLLQLADNFKMTSKFNSFGLMIDCFHVNLSYLSYKISSYL